MNNKFHLKAKKSLGQNFLKDKKIIDKIIKAGELKKGDIVLEVGPGKGHLTQRLLENDIVLFAVEKDKRLYDFLEEKFQKEIKEKKFFLIKDDVLNLDFGNLGLKNQKFKIIANLPYYITGLFISKTLENKIVPSLMVLLLQKEVVERVTDSEKNKKENIFSLSIKVFGKAKYIITVSKKLFKPVPKIDSAVLQISDISKENFKKNNITEQEFFEFIKSAFSNKRKQMLKNLSLKYNKEKLVKIFDQMKIDQKTRAEDLNLEIFLEILKRYYD
ncbi:ribosomal RNA small subunit methyltransferase A [Candidatus Campbellbacteria bacterium]|nr:MAG: ribosomal RNA small subunit methyltransferase A [Candidatus Campbellbacteria bacterium]